MILTLAKNRIYGFLFNLMLILALRQASSTIMNAILILAHALRNIATGLNLN